MRTTRHNAFAIFVTRALLALIAGVALFAVTAQAQTSGELTPSGPLVINGVGQNGMVISGLKITSTNGDCVQILNSSNVTIKNSEIGPCGTNNSTSPSRGVYISGGTGISVYDNYIHVENMASDCRDSHDGIFIINSTGPVTIQGNVIAYNENNIKAWDSSNISAIGNFLLNPRGATNCANPDGLPGHSFQVWADDATPNSNITFSNNYLLNSHDTTKYLYPSNVSDSINFGVTNGITAKNNYVVGGDYVNGCGLIADHKANNALFTGNIISDTFNCGIGIISGSSIVSDNKVLVTTPGSSHAVGIMLMTYAGSTCGPVNLSNNLAFAQHGTSSSGVVTGYWSDGNCTGVTSTSNTFDVGCTPGGNCTAYAQLYPMSSTNPQPPIPPQPHSCVANSPYSTQNSVLSCRDVLGALSVSGPNTVYLTGPVGGPFNLQ